MSKAKLALAQVASATASKELNLRKMESICSKARLEDSDIVVFPELSLTGYVCRDLFHTIAEPEDGSSISKIISLAREHDLLIVFGMPELDRKKAVIFNSAFLISAKKIIGTYRKAYLPSHTVFDEKRYFQAGTALPVFDTPFGRIGLEICYDVYFPEITRTLALRGAELVFCISASPGVRREYFEVLTRARAIENGLFFAYVNCVGIEEGLQFWGGSHVVSPTGALLVKAKYDEEDLVFAQIDTADLPGLRTFLPMLRDLRPEMFEEIGRAAASSR